MFFFVFFFSSRRRHTRCSRDWSSDVCSSDLQRRSQCAGLLPRVPAEQPGQPLFPKSLAPAIDKRSEEHTSELQSRLHLVCRLLLEKKKKNTYYNVYLLIIILIVLVLLISIHI